MKLRARLMLAAWTLSLAVPGAVGAGVYARFPRALVRPLDLALLAAVVASALWGVALASWLVLRVSRDHDAVLEVAGRVAAGDVEARVARRGTRGRAHELGREVDGMLAALDRLASSQRHFVAHAAHGLLPALNALIEELSRLQRAEVADQESPERAWALCQRLALLADDLLSLDRIGVALRDPATLSLREVALAAMEPVRAEARARGVALGVDGDGRARGRASDLQRMLRHLLENAVRHSPSGAPVRVILRDDPPFVTVRVRDQGPGVPPTERARVFEPFTRVEAEPAVDDPGAGLGLAIVREIARAHGGDVSLEPADPERRGATFTVRLPRA